jgi:predicted acylesterase/phospholipase RssA
LKPRTALVLSAGGLFGAWQAGVWRALADSFQPDLVVGASVGSLNGYAIAGGVSAQELAEFWLRPELARFRNLPANIQNLMGRYPARLEYAVVLTEAPRLKARIFTQGITWRHLAASCALPGVLRPYRIDGQWYTDGGLLNPLPVWAAIELGATRIVGVNVLAEMPPLWTKPFVQAFRRAAGHHPPVPAGIELVTLAPDQVLGSLWDALHWRRENIERWLEQGYLAAKNISLPICSER